MANSLLIEIAYKVWTGVIRLSTVRELLDSEVAAQVYTVSTLCPWGQPKWVRRVR